MPCPVAGPIIFTLVAANSRVSKLAEGVKRRHKPQGPEQSAVAIVGYTKEERK